MAFKSIGGGIVRLAFGVAVLGVAMPVAAERTACSASRASATHLTRKSIPSPAQASSFRRTGASATSRSLGGTGGALLEDTDGFAIGGKLGYDWQLGNIVVGGITDAFYSFADGNGRGGAPYKSELNYYGTVRGKLGYSFGRLMAYGTAGYAYGEFEVKNTGTGASASEMLDGWTYGGGLEYFWNRDINLHAGYRRIDFDDQTFSSLPAGQNTLSPEMDIIDFGLMTRF